MEFVAKKALLKVSLLAVSAMLSFVANAQKARLYDSQNGLPNSSINRISQSGDGFIWICTQNGLVRFDGREFSYIGKEDMFNNSDVQIFHEDSKGCRWVGTSRGLFYCDNNRLKFRELNLDGDGGSTAVHFVSDLAGGGGSLTAGLSEYLFVATSGDGVYPVDLSSMSVNPALRSRIQESLIHQYVKRLFLDSVGRLWICYEQGGITVVSGRTGRQLDALHFDNSVPNGGRDLYINDIIEDETEGRMYFAAADGIYVLESSSMSMRRAALLGKANVSATSLLLCNDNGRRYLTVGTENNGLKIFDMEQECIRDGLFPNVFYDLSHWKIHCILRDSQGNVWVGAYQTGILVLPRMVYGFFSYEFPSCVTSFASDGSVVWIGTDGAGLYRLKDGYPRESFTSSNCGLTNDSIMAVSLDGQGRLWIGTYLDGIFIRQPSGSIVPYRYADSLPSSKISLLRYDAENDVMYIGMFGGGVAVADASSGAIRKIIDDDGVKWPEDVSLQGSNLWIGSVTGLYRYNILLDELEGSAVKNTVILSCIQRQGKILAGTRQGIISYDPKTGQVGHIGVENGLVDNVVMGLVEGFDGDIWATTANGLSRISDGEIINYYSYDGLQGNEFRRAAVYRTDRKVYLGGMKGVTVISDSHFGNTDESPRSLRLTGLDIMDRQCDSLLLTGNPVKIRNRDKVFSISYSAMEYTTPQRVRYRYMMKGFDRDWVEDFGTRRASYTNLPFGKYEFCVEAYYEGGRKSSGVSLGLYVLPPWFLTWWALLIYALIVVAMAVMTVLWRRRSAASTLNRMRLDMFTDFTHEIRTPLNLVMSPLKMMREQTDDPALKDKYNLMYRNCLRINRIVNQLMDIRKIDSGKLILNFRQTDIIPFIRDIMQPFEQLAQSEGVNFTLESPLEENVLWVDQGNFDKMLFNVISNAFKHTPEGGEIRISVSIPMQNDGLLPSAVAEYVRIGVYNSGSHLDPKDLERVFERFFQTSPQEAVKGTGVGLNLAKMLVEKHHGRIVAENMESGVCFSVYLPCGKDHLSRQELNETLHHKDLYVTGPRDVADLEKAAMETHKSVRNRKTIVIVDDDADFLAYLNGELSRQFNVIAYTDAAKALAAVETVKPDAVLSDLAMEGMGGDELCRNIRNNPDTALIPVLILTGKMEEDASVKSVVDSGADRVLTKPVSMDYLKSSLTQAISIRYQIRARGDNSLVYDFAGIKISTASDRLVSKVLEVIKQNIDNQDLSVETLCREAGISRVHLNRKLKELVGTSPSVLIRNVRLRQAAYLLAKNNVNVSEVAFRVGYSSLSHFSNSFREYMGMSPREFVSRYQGTDDVSFLQQFELNSDS